MVDVGCSRVCSRPFGEPTARCRRTGGCGRGWRRVYFAYHFALRPARRLNASTILLQPLNIFSGSQVSAQSPTHCTRYSMTSLPGTFLFLRIFLTFHSSSRSMFWSYTQKEPHCMIHDLVVKHACPRLCLNLPAAAQNGRAAAAGRMRQKG